MNIQNIQQKAKINYAVYNDDRAEQLKQLNFTTD